MLAGCEEICRFFIRLPGSSVITGKPSPEKIIVYYTILFFMLFLVKRTEKKRFLLVWIGLVMMLCSGNQTKGAEVDFLDVGQGDGIFLQTKEGKGVFVDGGSTDVGKVGRYRILPFLKSRGIRKIELWFVSHADEDHISGLKEILEEGYPIECVVFTENVVRDEAIEKLVQLAEEKGSAIYDMKAGEQVKLEEARFTLLYPWKEGNDRNQNSMVLLTEVDGMTGVLPGDIGEGQEKEILAEAKNQKYLQKPLVFYKAAHHGADSSNSLEFLEKLKPIVSVISCGENNSYGHPGKNAVHRIEKVGAKVFYTMRSGQIQIKCDEREIIVKKYKN